MARSRAGTLAPNTPKELRTSTGKGTPYRVPAWEFSRMGTSTTRLPTTTAPTAACQVQPWSTSELASVYVGMQIAMPTQRAAMFHVVQVRREGSEGARSGFQSRGSRPSVMILHFAEGPVQPGDTVRHLALADQHRRRDAQHVAVEPALADQDALALAGLHEAHRLLG